MEWKRVCTDCLPKLGEPCLLYDMNGRYRVGRLIGASPDSMVWSVGTNVEGYLVDLGYIDFWCPIEPVYP